MKATGIVRRIDDLGRVVIPKEIRRTLRIREGDPLEIFTDREGEVILKKYSPIGELGPFATQYAESLSYTLGCGVCITDKDRVIAVTGIGKRDLEDKYISKDLERVIEDREQIMATMQNKKQIKITEEQRTEYQNQIICPIISEGDAIGTVILIESRGKKTLGELELKLALCGAEFLGRQMQQ